MSRYGYDYCWNPGVRDMLLERGTRPEVIDFIESIPDPKIRGKIVNYARSHPGATVDEIDAELRELPRQRTLTVDEVLILQNLGLAALEDEFSRWCAIQLIKFGVLGTEHTGEWSSTTWIDKLGEIRDWQQANEPEMASYDLTRALRESDEWHKAVEGEGSGRYYDNSGKAVYKWEDGYAVHTIESYNDIKCEGEKMRNCLRTNTDHYWDIVSRGTATLFSLRNQEGKPLVSVHFDEDGLVQAKAFNNSAIAPQHVKYVIDWLRSTGAPVKNVSEILIAEDSIPDWLIPLNVPPELAAGIKKYQKREFGWRSVERRREQARNAAMDEYEREMEAHLNDSKAEYQRVEKRAYAEYERKVTEMEAEIKRLEREQQEETDAKAEKKAFGRVLSKEERALVRGAHIWRVV